MKKSLKFIALLIATILTITLLALAALAEPSEVSPITEETSVESTTTEAPPASSSTAPEESSSTAPPAEESSQPEETTSEIPDETSDVTPDVSDTTSEDSKPSGPSEVKLSVETSNVSGYTVSVGGKTVNLSSDKIYSGDTVTITFKVDGSFDGSMAALTVNGESKSISSNSYSFTITGNTSVTFVYCRIPVSFSITGPGTIKISGGSQPQTFSSQNSGTDTQTFYLDSRVQYSVTVTPALGYQLGSVSSSANESYSGGAYSVRFSSGDTFSATMRASTGTVAPTSHTVRINVGTGGKVIADGRAIAGGSGTNLAVLAGSGVEFEIVPDDGYALDIMRVDNAEVSVSNNVYEISGISSDMTVQVLFKTTGEAPVDGISADEIYWGGDNINVDVRDGRPVLIDVFEKIATLTPEEGKYVEFIGNEAVIYVPYGGVTVGGSTYANMTVSLLDSGATYESISNALNAMGSSDIQHKIYGFNVGLSLPEGTKVAFILGEAYGGEPVVPVLFDSVGGSFSRKENVFMLAVSAGGFTDKLAYDGEGVIACFKQFPGKHIIESAALNAGGTISPIGMSEIADGASVTYTITSDVGYSIKQILIDDHVLEGVEGLAQYSYSFDNVYGSHSIRVEFVSDSADDTLSSPANEEEGGNNTAIVVTLIVIVAIAGAVALFIVKWRQEKY